MVTADVESEILTSLEPLRFTCKILTYPRMRWTWAQRSSRRKPCTTKFRPDCLHAACGCLLVKSCQGAWLTELWDVCRGRGRGSGGEEHHWTNVVTLELTESKAIRIGVDVGAARRGGRCQRSSRYAEWHNWAAVISRWPPSADSVSVASLR